MIVVEAESGRVVDVNKRACELNGYTREEYLALTVADLDVDSADWLTRRASVGDITQLNGTVIIGRHRRKDGTTFPMEITLTYIGLDRAYVLAVARDITEKLKIEQRLRLQVAALEAAANGIVITDKHGTIEWINPAFTRLTGYSLAEVIEHNPRILKAGTQGEQFYADLWHTILDGQVWNGEITNRRKDGTLYIEEMSIAPVRDENAEISHFVAIKQDITGEKRRKKICGARRRSWKCRRSLASTVSWWWMTGRTRFSRTDNSGKCGTFRSP